MTTSPDSDPQWFQWIFGSSIGLLTLLFGWTHRYIGQIKRDSELADARTRAEILKDVQTLRDDLNRRDEASAAVHQRQHSENGLRMAQIEANLVRMTDANAVERQHSMDHLIKLNDRLGQMATREEIRTMITGDRRRSPGG